MHALGRRLARLEAAAEANARRRAADDEPPRVAGKPRDESIVEWCEWRLRKGGLTDAHREHLEARLGEVRERLGAAE